LLHSEKHCSTTIHAVLGGAQHSRPGGTAADLGARRASPRGNRQTLRPLPSSRKPSHSTD
jgi:hypothetical protein